MQRIAQSWLVLEVTGDARVLGLVVAAQFAPMLFLGPWAGVLADRFDRRTILLWMQVAMALQSVGLALITLSGHANALLLVVAAAALGIITAVDGPARQAIVSDLVPPDHVVNAVALNSANFNAARLIGPAIAGLMIAAWGPGWVFLVNAATFAIMFGALLRIHTAPQAHSVRRGGLRDGVAYVRARPDLWFVIASVGVVATLIMNFQLTIALMTTDAFGAGPRTFGVLSSLMAIGSLTASLVQARRGRTGLRQVAMAGCAAGISILIAGVMPSVPAFALALAVCGAAVLTTLTSANAYLQTHADSEHRSRVMALYMAVVFGTTPLASPVLGAMAHAWGPRYALVIPGALCVVLCLLLVVAYRRVTDRLAAQDADREFCDETGAHRAGPVRVGTAAA